MAAGKKPFDKPAIGERFNPYGLFHGLFIPEQIASCAELKPGPKLIYGIIARYMGQRGICFVGMARFASESGLSEKVARGCLRQLRKQRFIEVEGRSGQSSFYHFLWHPVFEAQMGTGTTPLPKREGVEAADSVDLPRPSDAETPPETGRGTPAQMGTTPLPKREGDPCPNGQANTVTEYSHLKQSVENTILGASAPASASLSSLNSVLTSANSGLPADEPQKTRLDARPKGAARKSKSKTENRKAEAAAKPAARVAIEYPRWTPEELYAIRKGITKYVKGLEPPSGFEEKCELRAKGASAFTVMAVLQEKYNNPKYHYGRKYGPGGNKDEPWNWFLTVIGNEVDHAHLPEPVAAPASSKLPPGRFDEMTSALDGGEDLT